MRLNNIDFRTALELIVKELNLPFDSLIDVNKVKIKRKEKEFILQKVKRLIPNISGSIDNPKWDATDKDYWSNMFIPLSYLSKHNVYPINSYIVSDSIVVKRELGKPIYLYLEKFENKIYYKIYAPFYTDINKWKSNMYNVTDKLYHNLNEINKKGDLLIITKSVKDNIIFSYLGYNCISTQTEDLPLNDIIIKDLKKRYKRIIIFYDNDFNKSENYGIEFAKKEAIRNNLEFNYIPSKFECTDIAELALKVSTLKILKIIINNVIKKTN